MPSSQAMSISVKACSSVSPLPKNAGALPTPPKLPQPRPTAEIFSPVLPRFLYCTAPPFTTQVSRIEDLDIHPLSSILYPLSSILYLLYYSRQSALFGDSASSSSSSCSSYQRDSPPRSICAS